MAEWRAMGAAVQGGSVWGLPGNSGEPALFCQVLIHSQTTTTPCLARKFLSRKGSGSGCPFPPQKRPSSLWIRAFHIWSNIRSSGFLLHPDKPLIPATIWPKALSSCWVPFSTPSAKMCDLVAPAAACPAAPGARAGRCGARAVGVSSSQAQLPDPEAGRVPA